VAGASHLQQGQALGGAISQVHQHVRIWHLGAGVTVRVGGPSCTRLLWVGFQILLQEQGSADKTLHTLARLLPARGAADANVPCVAAGERRERRPHLEEVQCCQHHLLYLLSLLLLAREVTMPGTVFVMICAYIYVVVCVWV
jgi:hypothetical protein